MRNLLELHLEHERFTVVQGNVLNARSISVAMRGQDSVASTMGHPRYCYPTRILLAGSENILRAMETHLVRWFVRLSTFGISDIVGRLGLMYPFLVIPLILHLHFLDKARQERPLRQAKWTGQLRAKDLSRKVV